jgi:hypothetical protein
MIANLFQKVKRSFQENERDIYIAAFIFLAGMGGFGLGRLSVIMPQKEPLLVEYPRKIGGERMETQSGTTIIPDKKAAQGFAGAYVASKSGTAYHLPSCQSAQKIKEENKIWFATKEEAENAGYKPAGNCEGL